jgi:hypothetical protein
MFGFGLFDCEVVLLACLLQKQQEEMQLLCFRRLAIAIP